MPRVVLGNQVKGACVSSLNFHSTQDLSRGIGDNALSEYVIVGGGRVVKEQLKGSS